MIVFKIEADASGRMSGSNKDPAFHTADLDFITIGKFMIEFYRQWTSGNTKMEALKKAQSVIKQEYPDPQHWAAFILLDALD